MQIHTCMDKCIKTYTVNIYTQRYMHTHRYAHNTHTNIYNTCTHIEKYMHTHRYAHTYTDANTQIHTHTKQMTWFCTHRFMHISHASMCGTCVMNSCAWLPDTPQMLGSSVYKPPWCIGLSLSGAASASPGQIPQRGRGEVQAVGLPNCPFRENGL